MPAVLSLDEPCKALDSKIEVAIKGRKKHLLPFGIEAAHSFWFTADLKVLSL